MSDFEPLVNVLENVSAEDVVLPDPEPSVGVLSIDSRRIEDVEDVVKIKKRRRHSEGDICRVDEGLPESKRVERSPKSRGKGRPPGKKTGSAGGNAGDSDLPSVSVSDFAPLGNVNVNVLENVFAEEVVLPDPEPSEGVLNIDSRRMVRPALRRRKHAWPCGGCGKGVRSGLRCETCLLWFHNGKTKTCAGLKNRRQHNVESYSCPTCIKKNHKTDNPIAGKNNKPKNTRKRSLERAANETDEETSPVVKRTKNDGNLPKNNHLSMEEDISKTQEILDISTNSNDISINSNTEKVSYEDVYIQQMIQNFQTSEKDCNKVCREI